MTTSTVLHTTLKKKTSSTTGKGLERAQDIIAAACEIFATEGYAGLSMRQVALRAGMKLSNVQHYFQNKEMLVEAALLYTLSAMQEKIDRIATIPGTSRIEQFHAAVDAMLAAMRDPQPLAMHFECWALASRLPFAAALMERMRKRETRAMLALIKGLAPGISDDEYARRADLIVAMLNGLMTQLRHAGMGRQRKTLEAAARRALVMLATQA